MSVKAWSKSKHVKKMRLMMRCSSMRNIFIDHTEHGKSGLSVYLYVTKAISIRHLLYFNAMLFSQIK